MTKEKTMTKNKWYHFHQNNSGGYFEGPAIEVFVEASSAEKANDRATSVLGLYFGGAGDCQCCGDRWYPAFRDDNVVVAPSVALDRDSHYDQRAKQDGIPRAIKLRAKAKKPTVIGVKKSK